MGGNVESWKDRKSKEESITKKVERIVKQQRFGSKLEDEDEEEEEVKIEDQKGVEREERKWTKKGRMVCREIGLLEGRWSYWMDGVEASIESNAMRRGLD